MKIARYLFQWSGDARYADYYERAILNGMLGVQRMPANYKSQYKTTTSQPISFTRSALIPSAEDLDLPKHSLYGRKTDTVEALWRDSLNIYLV